MSGKKGMPTPPPPPPPPGKGKPPTPKQKTPQPEKHDEDSPAGTTTVGTLCCLYSPRPHFVRCAHCAAVLPAYCFAVEALWQAVCVASAPPADSQRSSPQPASCMLAQVRASASQRRKLKQLHWDKIRGSQEGTIWSKAKGQHPNLNFAELESLFQVSKGHNDGQLQAYSCCAGCCCSAMHVSS